MILKTFDKHDYGRYWFSTGTLAFLIHKLENSDFNPQQLGKSV